MFLGLVSAASTVVAVETGHWFAVPFAMIFTFGYGYHAFFVAFEQLMRRKAHRAREAAASLQVTASGTRLAALEASGRTDELAA